MTTKERILNEMEVLDDMQLKTLEEFLLSLKASKPAIHSHPFDENELARLYGEYVSEDIELAEADLPSFVSRLESEDRK